jgi:myo-inositol-1-phosphate synthase
VVIDAVRLAKIGLDRGLAGPLLEPSAYFMKSPPVQIRDEEARLGVEAFIAGESMDAPIANVSAKKK